MPLELRNKGHPPKYTNHELFTIQFHHGGKIEGGKYVGGVVQWADNYNIDEMSILDLYEAAACLVYDHLKTDYHYRNKTRGFVPILAYANVVDFVSEIPSSKVHSLYLTPKPQLQFVESQASAAAHPFRYGNLINSQSQRVSVQFDDPYDIDVGIIDADDEFEDEDEDEFLSNNEEGAEFDDLQDVYEEDLSRISKEPDIEFIDSDYEQSEQERDNQEDDILFHRHVVDDEDEEPYKEPGEVESEDYNSAELLSVEEESGEEGKVVNKPRRMRKAPRFKQFRREIDLIDPTFHLGMEFPTMEQCREAIRYYAVASARPLKWVKNDPNKIRLTCEGKTEGKCPWLLYASHVRKRPTTRIKTYRPNHTCSRLQRTKYATSSWLAKRFDEELRDNPNMSVGDFMKIVRRKYAIDITHNQFYKAKRAAQERIQGSIEEQYAKLWDYCEELKINNPGSTVLVKTDLEGDNTIFRRIYICYGALKKGFLEGCRPVVGFDGCFIKGPHPGQILSVVGIDANNGMYPIAFAVVEVENRETWTWFMEIFFTNVGIQNGKGWVFITDKQKGLGQAIQSLMPTAEHRHCVRHLHENFKTAGHTGLALKQRLWAAARATTIPNFEAEMDKMLSQSAAAFKWLEERPPHNWSRSHFTVDCKCDILLNNLCESFNAAIIEARDKPIITLLERIRTYLMLRMARLRETIWHQQVGPRVVGIIEKNTVDSGQCIASYAGEGKYQVNTMYGGMYVVDLDRHSCSCRKWDLCGIPCPHAMTAIAMTEKSPLEFVHSLYKRSAYDRAYKGYISPMPGPDQWKKTEHGPIKPPVYHKQPGRPRTSRQKKVDEIPRGATKLRRYDIVITCGRCGVEGHNAAKCGGANQGNLGERGARGVRGARGGRARGVRGGGGLQAQAQPQRRAKFGVRRGGHISQVTRPATVAPGSEFGRGFGTQSILPSTSLPARGTFAAQSLGASSSQPHQASSSQPHQAYASRLSYKKTQAKRAKNWRL